MPYYKVVQSFDRYTWYSAWMRENGVAVEYKVGKWARPRIKGAPLVVFDSLAVAENWCRDARRSNNAIFECDVQVSKFQPKFFHTTSIFTDSFSVREFWRGIRDGYEPNNIPVPPGSVFCNRVKLTKLVHDYR